MWLGLSMPCLRGIGSISVLRADTRLDGALRLASSALIESLGRVLPAPTLAVFHVWFVVHHARAGARSSPRGWPRLARRAGRAHGGRRAGSADAFGHKAHPARRACARPPACCTMPYEAPSPARPPAGASTRQGTARRLTGRLRQAALPRHRRASFPYSLTRRQA